MSAPLTRRRLLAIAASAALVPATAKAETWRGVALGARATITLRGSTAWRAQAFAAVQADIARAEALFSLYRPDSWISRLNAAGRADLPGEVAALLRQISTLHRATEGQFDPTIQPLWTAMAEGGDGQAARQAIGWGKLSITPSEIRLQPRQALSLNGIAQGWATDRVAATLRDRGAEHVLVQVGEMRALEGPFRIGLPEGGMATLTDSALATSAPGVLRLGDGTHILSPDGRRPRWATLTVEADHASLADGLSTAGIFLNPDQLRRARAQLPGIRRIWAATDTGDIAQI